MLTGSMKESFFNDATTNLSLDYHSVLQSISEFRRSNGKTSQIAFDTPQTYYFKLFFYFDNQKSASPAITTGIDSSNLLGLYYDGTALSGLPWEGGQVLKTDDVPRPEHGYVPVNTALNYLLINYEWDRAQKLTKFITLLSELSYKYPWYFQSISGLDNAINRKEVTDKDFKIEEQRRSFQIKCLPDSDDNKIGKLLDLYRDIVWSQEMHKEILPANLRKFDMGIFIFSKPIKNMHRRVGRNDIITTVNSIPWDKPSTTTGDYANFAPEFDNFSSGYKTSYKYIEFHNCEIDYNSSASVYNELNNKEGFNQEYSINIFYDNALENRYDEWLMKNIGDFSIWDLNLNSEKITGSEEAWWNSHFDTELMNRSTQEAERTDRSKLLTFKGDVSVSIEDQLEERGDYPGITAQDLAVKGTIESNGSFWSPKLTPPKKGAIFGMYNQLYGYVKKNYINPKVKEIKKLVLGNFYAVQFKNAKKIAKDISNGNLFGAIDKSKKMINGWKQKS